MKKTVFLLVIILLTKGKISAQSLPSGPANHTNGKNHIAGFGINMPLGEFSETHIAGISLHYSWSHRRFGKMSKLPEKLIGFIADGGADYYIGKKETVAGYDYRYDGYIYLHAFAGAIYNPSKKTNISLTTGPTLGIHKGHTDFGFGIAWKSSYYFSEKMAITPGLIYMKHTEANALWAISVQAAYSF